MSLVKHVPAAVGVLAVVVVAAGALPPSPPRGFDVAGFASLPVLDGGRVKPLDSLARNSLLVIRGKQQFPFGGRTITHDEWILDVLFRPDVADAQPVFVIDDPDVLGLLGRAQTADRYFSFDTLKPSLAQLDEQGRNARMIDAKERNRFQSAMATLHQRLVLYSRLKSTLQLEGGPTLAAELRAATDPASTDTNAAARRTQLAEGAHFRIVPPTAAGAPWRSTGEALVAEPTEPMLAALAAAGAAWAADDSAAFNSAVPRLIERAKTVSAASFGAATSELLFNRVQPFYAGMVIYVLALLVLFASWLAKPEWLSRTAFSLLAAGALVHTVGLVSRIVLQGRPPVTNLYSSAVFVGWGAVVVGVVVERMYRTGFGTAVAAGSGFASLIVAHHLAADGDTMEMMRAVLDSNFWLATHVVTITIGYSGTFLAGGLAIAWTVRRLVTRETESKAAKSIVSMGYGVLCFSLFFSFVGTVLGGIWADQSWGRFWGWDPKENGALLIVLWNAIILHARLAGLVRDRGLMGMSIVGNVITSLSWFGVNMLGVGLHSYGFMDKAFWALAAFDASQFVLLALCLWPLGAATPTAAKTEDATPPAPPAPPAPVAG